jgi:3-deoxy-D-manno-octulosonic-acid transferase
VPPLWYRAAWALARPLARLALGDGKFARAVRGRAVAADALVAWAAARREPSRPLLWIHAASVGEGRQAEAVLVRLRAAQPKWQYLFTHSSPSAERLAASLPVAYAGYVPADTPGDAGRALDAVRPALLCFSATDVWPELVHQAAHRGVRLALVSANLAERSSRLGAFARALLRDTYAALDRVGAIDEADAARFVALGAAPERVVVTGDARHDAAQARAAALDRTAPHLRALAAGAPDARPVVVAGSTWPRDEACLLEAARKAAAAPVRLVVAPHEPNATHLAELRPLVARRLPAARVRTLGELEADASAAWDICLVDRVGVLAELYGAAAVAYVGGGFGRAGLHSVIEPAALGVPVLFGPHWQASRDARLLRDAGAGRAVDGADDLADALAAWLCNETARATAGAAARAVVERGRGAADRSVSLLLGLMEGRGA